ncbi:hypothetical protein OEV98_09915 [Caldibacillus lycopersici]|uniref:Uncharacterized protein n=1 Tax=Perspicuibacillus lycopersici TaxID=1325689 RepID=A0AAE3IXJ5_9BACI|nr:hypothetical protein [Perspicuibacillus lycopersici]MCU9613875.1 hypothetical protein [Perspicuibacillus lycopersici]
MKIFHIILFAICTIFASIYWGAISNNKVVESITYFPSDPEISYLDAKTKISEPISQEKHYQVQVNTLSRLENPVYMRQDISLIFANGRLIGKMGKWEEKTESIQNEFPLNLKNNRLLRAVTFHHSEIHKENQLYSAQTMSSDFLYIVHSSVASLLAFQTPATEEDIGWMEVLNKAETEVIQLTLQSAAEVHQLNLEHYHIIPLSELPNYNEKPLPSLTKEQSNKIIGQLWEGLYKNYFLGIKKSDGTILSPLNSTIPVILLAKNHQHLYVVFETDTGESILLKQLISNNE